MLRILLAAAAVFSMCLSPFALAGDDKSGKAVLVTGASTGIGRNIAETLAADGYRVYAGARKEKDLAELDAIDNIVAVRLDVTSQNDVDAAVAFIAEQGHGLYGLVNNAGVATFSPVAGLSDDDLEFVLDVNVDGVVRVTRAFIPQIVASKGRIVTTGSISGILSAPAMSAYSMSKHAMEAFTDSLAAELGQAGVSVSVVEPGNYQSRIRRTTAARIQADTEARGNTLSEQEQQLLASIVERETTLKEPDEVTAAVRHALFSDAPLRRYMVVPEQGEAEMTIRKAIEELVQLNAWGPYSYDRDELIQLLDEALGAQSASD